MRPSLRNFPKKLGEKFFSVAPERPLFTVIFLRLRCAPYDLSSKPSPAICSHYCSGGNGKNGASAGKLQTVRRKMQKNVRIWLSPALHRLVPWRIYRKAKAPAGLRPTSAQQIPFTRLALNAFEDGKGDAAQPSLHGGANRTIMSETRSVCKLEYSFRVSAVRSAPPCKAKGELHGYPEHGRNAPSRRGCTPPWRPLFDCVEMD